MLSAKDIADILGKAQVLAATWLVQGGFVFQAGGQTLSIDDTNGVSIKDLYGKVQLHLPIAGPPFLLGETSSAITPKATLHLGDGDKHQLNNLAVLDAATVLACWKNSIVQTGFVNVAGFYLRQKYSTTGTNISLEAVTWCDHSSGSVAGARGILGAAILNGKGGSLSAGYGVWGTAQSFVGTLYYGAGIVGTILASADGTVGDGRGVYSAVYATNTGTVTDGYAFYGLLSNSGATMPTVYGLRIMYEGDIVTKWGIYIQDAAAKNYLQGWLGVGYGAALNYEKLTVYQPNNDNFSYPAVLIERSGTAIYMVHQVTTYGFGLGLHYSAGHPWVCMHGSAAPATANTLKNDGTTFRGLGLTYIADASGSFGRANIQITANRSNSANAEFTDIYRYLEIGRALGLPQLNSSEMNALTAVPAGAMIYNTTRAAICVYAGGVWVTLGTTAYTDTHSDIPHTDTHGDAHTDTHGDAGHTDSHTDTPYQDVTHIDTHTDTAHADTPHVDTHGDVHSDHTDDEHSDWYYDVHGDEHGDVRHVDIHNDAYTDHNDGGHGDSYSDYHGDTHTDTHSDTIHTDQHFDHTDEVHSDAHTDTHGDTAHVDTPYVDTHADTPHTDEAYVDSHTDSTHTDTHGDTAHEDWYTDHSDAV